MLLYGGLVRPKPPLVRNAALGRLLCYVFRLLEAHFHIVLLHLRGL